MAVCNYQIDISTYCGLICKQRKEKRNLNIQTHWSTGQVFIMFKLLKNQNLTSVPCVTGDIGYYDEDEHVIISDRLKELIKYKGFPGETLYKHHEQHLPGSCMTILQFLLLTPQRGKNQLFIVILLFKQPSSSLPVVSSVLD